MTSYRDAVIDSPFLTRRAYEAGGPDAMVGSAVGKLVQLQREYQVGQVIFAWEARGADHGMFRRRMDEEYKARRSPPPQEYMDAIADLQQQLPLLGVYQATSEAEADDVAHTIATTWPGPHLLWSADKDWNQFVREDVHLLKPDCKPRPRDVAPEDFRRPPDALVTPETIVDLTGLDAAGWFEVLCMQGDNVDGIRGLPRVGAKRARDLHAACPQLVRWLLADRDREENLANFARAKCAANNAAMVKWVELAIQHTELLRATAELVRPYRVELEVTEPVAPTHAGFEAVRAWLARHHVEGLLDNGLAELLIPADEDDPFAPDVDPPANFSDPTSDPDESLPF